MFKKLFSVILIIIMMQSIAPAQSISIRKTAEDNLNFAVRQYTQMLTNLDTTKKFPRSANKDGILSLVGSDDWTSGFFPGSLWYLYEFTKNKFWKKNAELYTGRLSKEQYNTQTHDVGFMINCSYGNGYRLIDTKEYKKVIIQAAKSLSKRFRPIIGCIQSWGSNNRWECPVIIDNMMNLELLFWATQQTGDSSFYKIAVAHADQTLKNHYRDDGSSYHVLNYDQQNGEIINKKTAQGYSDESAWARGQAWGLYGYIVAYRETGQKRYLQHAQKIAGFILNHPHLPEDCVPYWDFDAPDIPNAKRDASAGAIMASAMIELSGFVDNSEKEACLNFAKTALRTLSSPEYRAGSGENNNYLLKHGVGHMPNNSEVDVPLCYADYYYVEALIRMKRLQEN